MLTGLIFILIIGVLIFVHELGHFVTARRNGIRAYEFGFGFPPRVIGVQKISDPKTGKKKWRTIWGSYDGDNDNEKRDWEGIEKDRLTRDTIYSLNWIPIGGFVKIKGEDGSSSRDQDSFASRGAWTRIKVLAAGVIMNFVLAWILISLVFMLGAPEAVDPNETGSNSKIQISGVLPGSPAEEMGIKVGDEIAKDQISVKGEKISFENVPDVQNYINSHRGEKVSFKIIRGKNALEVSGTPRVETSEGEGPLGITLAQTRIVKYPWYQAIWKGLLAVFDLIAAILVAFYGLISSLFMGKGVAADIAGPVGIAVLTRDVANLGLVYLLQFAAILSVNLGIINALPIPALDGGRILFVLIEKIRRKPVSQKVEQVFHTVFFVLLIILMMVVTFRDVAKLL